MAAGLTLALVAAVQASEGTGGMGWLLNLVAGVAILLGLVALLAILVAATRSRRGGGARREPERDNVLHEGGGPRSD